MGSPVALPLIVLLPWLATPALWLVRGGPRTGPAWVSALALAAALLLLLGLSPQVFSGEVVAYSLPWMPGLGLAASFRVDGLAFLFAFLILAIGLLIVLYAAYYLSDERRLARFFALLMFFAGAMLGVALSSNLLLLFVFWELTSLSSFLLVGYWWRRADAREGARIALAVTGAGGLALLAGILLLGHVAGGFELSVVLASRDEIQSSPLYLPMLALILLGAFTKSAQFPFHFWLPGAMAAPTPVSAYLHSATMVKAGIFLLARLYPVLSGSDAWFFALVGVGLTTLVFGAYQAIFRHDLKGLLAYSTVSHLGLITLLLGLSTPLSAVAAVFHIVNHATFKASLFMAAGIIDHECGTRDMRRINGLWRYMPYTALLAMIAAASMAGVPLVNGFLSKEMFFGEALALERGGGLRWIMPLAAVAGGVFSVAYSLRFIHDVFFHGEPVNLPKTPHEPPRWMRIPVEILVVVCLLVGIFPAMAVAPLLEIAATAVLGTTPPPFSLAVWHGVNTPLIMSGVALGVGVLLYFLIQYGLDLHSHVQGRQMAKRIFDRLLFALSVTARALIGRLSQGGLTTSVLLTVIMAGVAGVGPFLLVSGSIGSEGTTPVDPMAFAVFALMCVSAVSLTFAYRNRLLALILLSVVGLMNALAFVYFSAPDLALTQVSVEVVTILLLLLALNHLPQDSPPERSVTRALREFGLAMLAGGGVGWLTWAILTRPFESISTYFLRESVPQGGGANVVNVILVDFRGFDTFGEMIVIAIAALGIAALLHDLQLLARGMDGEGRAFAREFSSVLLVLLTRALLPLALMVSLYLFLRGHDAPGGGFIAGLVTAVALVLQYFGSGRRYAQPRLPLDGRVLAATGLLIGAATGAGAWLFDAPFLTSAHGHAHLPVIGDVALASAILFDLGVYLTVVGGTMLILTLLGGGGVASESGQGR